MDSKILREVIVIEWMVVMQTVFIALILYRIW